MMQRTANENAAYKCRIRYAAHFLHGLAMIFLWDSLCLSAVSLSRQRHDIPDFSCCPLSRVLHVALVNWQRFGFEFHLRSSPSAYSGFVNISRPAESFTACYTVLKSQQGRNSCPRLQFGFQPVWTLSCRCPVKLST